MTFHPHPNYIYSCHKCGDMFQKNRDLSRDLSGYVALVTGGRTKLGHQVVLKLVRNGAHVFFTTRKYEQSRELFCLYDDYDAWKDRIHVFHKRIDFDIDNMQNLSNDIFTEINDRFGRLDILVNCAAQTIRSREKMMNIDVATTSSPKNRYNDPDSVDELLPNSWSTTIFQAEQQEMEEVYRINTIAPFILTRTLIPLLVKSSKTPFIINVHAREGLIGVRKGTGHVHLNMAKCGLSMFTKCLLSYNLQTENGDPISIHGVDPGWISVDEYYTSNKPFPVAPLDEIDGAARILFPVMKNIIKPCGNTRRHFNKFAI